MRLQGCGGTTKRVRLLAQVPAAAVDPLHHHLVACDCSLNVRRCNAAGTSMTSRCPTPSSRWTRTRMQLQTKAAVSSCMGRGCCRLVWLRRRYQPQQQRQQLSRMQQQQQPAEQADDGGTMSRCQPGTPGWSWGSMRRGKHPIGNEDVLTCIWNKQGRCIKVRDQLSC